MLQNTDKICQHQNVANRSNLRYVANIEHNDETLYTVNWMPKEIPQMMGQQKETEEETACLALHRLHVGSAVLPAAPPLLFDALFLQFCGFAFQYLSILWLFRLCPRKVCSCPPCRSCSWTLVGAASRLRNICQADTVHLPAA